MFRFTRAHWAAAMVAAALLAGGAIWTLLHPASAFVQPWRAERTQAAEGVIFGPYPVEEDFVALKAEGVTTIVSLLNPVVPYEKVLLDQERKRAKRHGIKLVNFPMGSILGQKFGDDYVANSEAAARAALEAEGTAYIHCYLGVNRAKYVQAYIRKLDKKTTQNYAGASGSFPMDDIEAFERLHAAYQSGNYTGAIQVLAGMQSRSAQALSLEAWSNYKLGRIVEAHATFSRLLNEHPGHVDAMTGLGYTALRLDDIGEAERHFTDVLAKDGQEVAAIEGLGHVRFRQARRTEARELFERALQANPLNTETREMLDRLSRMESAIAGSSP